MDLGSPESEGALDAKIHHEVFSVRDCSNIYGLKKISPNFFIFAKIDHNDSRMIERI